MADLIDRAALLEWLKNLESENNNRIRRRILPKGLKVESAIYMVNKLPAVDAVEVVRCKDCTWGKWWQNKAGVEGFGCELLCADITTEGFCSFGERRTDADLL